SWAAGEATGSEASTANAAESTPAELRQRIESLKAQLADLNAELDASKDTPEAASQDPAAQAPAAAPAPAPLPTPAMSGPLATGIPHELPAGPFGKIEVTGILSGIGLFSNHPFRTGDEGHIDV